LLLVDLFFDGVAKRHIYGPKDLALAVKEYGPERTHLNADGYAQFASCKIFSVILQLLTYSYRIAIYWLKRLGGFPRPSAANPIPDGY
jgi:hypothetical protein